MAAWRPGRREAADASVAGTGGGAGPRPIARARLGVVDLARGAAVVAMAVYHTGWDLGALQITPVDPREIRAWEIFARVIAASFLLLVGVGLVLAHGRGFRRAAFLRRLAVVAAAALVVSVVTYFAFPDSWIFFGILHCIALSSVLALPFLRLPVAVTAAVAAFVIALPFLHSFAVFDMPLLAFVGLGDRIPQTNDYVPLFPWFGFVLLGIVAMRLGAPLMARLPERTRAYPAALRGLAFLGRHSLIVYLLHQPVIYGLLAGYVAVAGPSPVAEAAPFLRSCQRSCGAYGSRDAYCRATCACAVSAFRREGLWPRIVANSVTAEDQTRLPALWKGCFDQARPDGG